QMRQHDLLQPRRDRFAHQHPAFTIRQVAHVRRDPPLEEQRIWAVRQHDVVMVRLDHQHVDVLYHPPDRATRVPQIRADGRTHASIDSGSIPTTWRRLRRMRGPNPASITTRLAPLSTRIALPRLPLPSTQSFTATAWPRRRLATGARTPP